nr:hypothetical protein [Morganella morganii]
MGQGLRGNNVIAVIARLKQLRQRVPELFQTDNNSEFISKILDKRGYENGGNYGLLPARKADGQYVNRIF